MMNILKYYVTYIYTCKLLPGGGCEWGRKDDSTRILAGQYMEISYITGNFGVVEVSQNSQNALLVNLILILAIYTQIAYCTCIYTGQEFGDF